MYEVRTLSALTEKKEKEEGRWSLNDIRTMRIRISLKVE